MSTTLEDRLNANLLASDAATARTAAGPCSVCRRVIGRGDRYAVLLSRRLAHVHCVARRQDVTPFTTGHAGEQGR